MRARCLDRRRSHSPSGVGRCRAFDRFPRMLVVRAVESEILGTRSLEDGSRPQGISRISARLISRVAAFLPCVLDAIWNRFRMEKGRDLVFHREGLKKIPQWRVVADVVLLQIIVNTEFGARKIRAMRVQIVHVTKLPRLEKIDELPVKAGFRLQCRG